MVKINDINNCTWDEIEKIPVKFLTQQEGAKSCRQQLLGGCCSEQDTKERDLAATRQWLVGSLSSSCQNLGSAPQDSNDGVFYGSFPNRWGSLPRTSEDVSPIFLSFPKMFTNCRKKKNKHILYRYMLFYFNDFFL